MSFSAHSGQESNRRNPFGSFVFEIAQKLHVLLLMLGLNWISTVDAAEGTNHLSTAESRLLPGQKPGPSDGTRKMVARLRQLADQANPGRNRFLSRERAQGYGAMLRGSTNYPVIDRQGSLYANELLQSGQSERAMRQFRLLERFYTEVPAYANPQKVLGMKLGEALSALRIGEQENCLANHTSEACLFPLSPGGFHALPRGSMTAIPVLTNLLNAAPDDLRARWLLNIAHMTLGEWPDKVPERWRIGPEVFASDLPFPKFPEVAGSLGLDVDELGGGTVIEDFDNDGFLDVLISSWGLRSPLRYFHNDGNGKFTERTHEAGLDGLWGGLNMISADYNNDGFVDVLILRGAWLGTEGHLPHSLLRNNGNGTFSDVTEESGMLSSNPTQTATWFDYDGDGWIDVFIGNETQPDIPGDVNPCELFHNNGDGTFTECAATNGLAVVGWVKAVVSADYDGDGRPDLYLSLRDGGNRLFRNQGPVVGADPKSGRWKFEDVTVKAGVTGPRFSFPTWFFDYNQDGKPDLFIAGYRIRHVGDIVADYLGQPSEGEHSRLYRNNGDGTFTDVSKEAHLDRVLHAMGSNFGDLDNDGFPDFYLGTGDPDLLTLVPNRMFRNAGGKFFQDVTTATHTGHVQ